MELLINLIVIGLFLISIVAFIAGIVTLIVLLVQMAKKKPVRKTSITAGSLIGGSVAAFLIMIVVMIAAPAPDSTTTTASYPSSSSEAQPDEETEYSEPNAHIEDTSNDESEADEEEVIEEEEPAEEEPAEEEDLMTEDVEEVEEEIDESENPENLDNYRTDVDVRDIERNPDEFEGEFITFEGKIIQVMEGDVMNGYRVAVNDDYDRIVYVETLAITLDERLLEDDYITVYGSFNELVTYETVVGGSRTLPGFTAHGDRMILQ